MTLPQVGLICLLALVPLAVLSLMLSVLVRYRKVRTTAASVSFFQSILGLMPGEQTRGAYSPVIEYAPCTASVPNCE